MNPKPVRLGIVMDPIGGISPRKDSSLAMLLEAQARGYALSYMEQGGLWLDSGTAWGEMRPLGVADDPDDWFELGETERRPLAELDVILMRKDPPFDMEYVYTTYILERAEEAGCLVVNRPAALRDMNEKAYTAWFPEFVPRTVVTRSMETMRQFLGEVERMVVKPLDGMGGRSIFTVRRGEPNTNVILETLTGHGHRFAMAQQFIPEITEGDKRVIIVDGEPVPYCLARIPTEADGRGNLVMGAKGVGRELGTRDREIATTVGAVLKREGVLFAGLDVIGDYLTEINVTSPTGIRELDREYGINIAGSLFDAIESRLAR
ncbi:MAG: glutathione synthase [Gammaproteobacteria bacterium]|jgi:glutathione synthase